MNTLMKIIVFSAPLFALTLLIYLAVHKQFRADFVTENVRFESEWKTFQNLDPKKDPFFAEQQKEASALLGKAKQADENLEVTEKELKAAIEDMEKENKKSSYLRPPELPHPKEDCLKEDYPKEH